MRRKYVVEGTITLLDSDSSESLGQDERRLAKFSFLPSRNIFRVGLPFKSRYLSGWTSLEVDASSRLGFPSNSHLFRVGLPSKSKSLPGWTRSFLQFLHRWRRMWKWRVSESQSFTCREIPIPKNDRVSKYQRCRHLRYTHETRNLRPLSSLSQYLYRVGRDHYYTFLVKSSKSSSKKSHSPTTLFSSIQSFIWKFLKSSGFFLYVSTLFSSLKVV